MLQSVAPMAARRPLVACLLYRGGLRRRPHPNADHSLVSYRLWRRSANRRRFWQWALADFSHQGATTTDHGAMRLTRAGAWRRALALPGRGGNGSGTTIRLPRSRSRLPSALGSSGRVARCISPRKPKELDRRQLIGGRRQIPGPCWPTDEEDEIAAGERLSSSPRQKFGGAGASGI